MIKVQSCETLENGLDIANSIASAQLAPASRIKNGVPNIHEHTMTTKELANALGVDVDTVNNTVKRLGFSEILRKSNGGRPTKVFTEEQATVIKQEIQKHHNLANRQIDNVSTEMLISTKELAEQLGTRPNVITENAKKCLPEKIIENGKPTLWTKAEVAILIECLKTNNSNQFNLSGSLIGVSTELTPALKIKKAMELMQEGYEEELAILRSKIEEQKPKVETYERISNSTGLKTIKEVADILGYGEKTYFALLRDMGILFRENGINLPKREYINSGYFEVKEEPYERNGKTFLYSRIYVTAKGLLWLEKKTPSMKIA